MVIRIMTLRRIYAHGDCLIKEVIVICFYGGYITI